MRKKLIAKLAQMYIRTFPPAYFERKQRNRQY